MKAQKLEKSLEQMNAMYQSVISEKSSMKVDLTVAEKRIIRKDEKIVQLEKNLAVSRDKVRINERNNKCIAKTI
jgi:hypothetical protein